MSSGELMGNSGQSLPARDPVIGHAQMTSPTRPAAFRWWYLFAL